LEGAYRKTENLKEWWMQNFTTKRTKYPQPDIVEIIEDAADMQESKYVIMADEMVKEEVMVSQQELAEVQVNIPANKENATGFAKEAASQDKKVVVQEQEKASTDKPSQAPLNIHPVKYDSEYTKRLTGKVEADYAVYLQLRPEYLHTPKFYFDMADWFLKLNDREKAIRILTSIADIDLENASLFRLLGYRLKEYKEYALEAFICKKVIQWRPMEPQSYRDYALALADNGQYQVALDSLYSVITQSYAQNINSRSEGIEEVVVMELNQLINKNPKLNTTSIDPKLIKAMPVDIRVVINWNMNSTDIDLHVKDTYGETCYYSHRTTAMGGRISRDITQGYGPEQFLLKHAVKGKYEVFVNYFGDSQVKAEGPSTIMAEIYTRYSDKTEQRQVVCLQMSKENKQKDGLIKVAEFEF
jgi:tetratricopeptide (TPR) repeat protein